MLPQIEPMSSSCFTSFSLLLLLVFLILLILHACCCLVTQSCLTLLGSHVLHRPLDFTFQDVWLQVSDHTIVIISVMKTFFVQFFCVFLPPLLNIFCFCQVHTISVLYCAHLCMKSSLGISHFLEDISSLSHSIVFLYFFALITEEGFLISLLAILWNCAFKRIYLYFSPLPLASLLFSATFKASSNNHFYFLSFFFRGWS